MIQSQNCTLLQKRERKRKKGKKRRERVLLTKILRDYVDKKTPQMHFLIPSKLLPLDAMTHDTTH
jgi:hypothetical protein